MKFFPSIISVVNENESAENWGFVHIYKKIHVLCSVYLVKFNFLIFKSELAINTKTT